MITSILFALGAICISYLAKENFGSGGKAKESRECIISQANSINDTNAELLGVIQILKEQNIELKQYNQQLAQLVDLMQAIMDFQAWGFLVYVVVTVLIFIYLTLYENK